MHYATKFNLLLLFILLSFSSIAKNITFKSQKQEIKSVKILSMFTQLEVGEETYFLADLSIDTAFSEIVWSSLDTNIFLVGQDGLVKAKNVGKSYLKLESRNGLKDSLLITVSPDQYDEIKIETVSAIELHKGDSLLVSELVVNDVKKLNYLSMNDSIVMVEDQKWIRAINIGQTTLKIYNSNLKTKELVIITVSPSYTEEDNVLNSHARK